MTPDESDPNYGLSAIPADAVAISRPRPAADPLFDEFWSVYPRKVGKVGAQRSWERVIRKGGDPKQIIAAAERFRVGCRADKTDRKFIPHPASWLRDGRYGDEEAQPEPAPVKPAARVQVASRLNDEQILAAVIALAADRDKPVTAAGEIVRIVRENSAAVTWNGFPVILAERAAELAAMPYAEYLQTPEWQERRQVMLRLAGRRCKVCNGADRLHVHHRTYERRGNEQPADLTVLCEGCHKLFHDNGKLVSEPAA